MLNPHLPSPKLASKPARKRSLISLTPLIDVVFILLVFFMLASSFMEWKVIDLTADTSESSTAPSETESLLLLVSQHRIRLNEKEMPLNSAIQTIETHLNQHPDQVLQIQPEKDTPLQPVVDVLDALHAAGTTRFTLIRDSAWEAPKNPQPK